MQKYNIFKTQQSLGVCNSAYFFSSFKPECRIDCNIDKSMLNHNAVQKLLTLNPLMNLSANKMMQALITSKNNPKVTIVMGKVRIINTGFTSKFNTDNTTATIIAVKKLST